MLEGHPKELRDIHKASTGATREARRYAQDKFRGLLVKPWGDKAHLVCKKLKLRLSDGLLAGLAQGSEGKSRL